MYSAFSERTFEFCYNAEYCRLNAGILATHPSIPSQNEEKDLGYDVEFQLLQLGHVRSLFLQHKIVHFAGSRAGRNARFFNAHGGPYYRFPVDTHQHNVLHDLSANQGDAFYCAPAFNRTIDLRQAYETLQICGQSVWLDPMEVGRIFDVDSHHTTFSEDGTRRYLHSEVRSFSESPRGTRSKESLRETEVSAASIEEFAEFLSESSKSSSRREKMDAEIERERPQGAVRLEDQRPIKIIQQVLARVYDVSWIVLPA